MGSFICTVLMSLLASVTLATAGDLKYRCPPERSIVQSQGAQTIIRAGEADGQIVEGYHFSATNDNGEWRGFMSARETIALHELSLADEELDKYPPVCSYRDAAHEVKLTLHP